MIRMFMGNSISLRLLMLFSLFILLTVPCYGGVIFEDNFDSQPDWNANGGYESAECSVGSCAANTYPVNWSFYRVVPGSGGLSPIGAIRRLPGNAADHTTGTGKAYIAYNQSVPNVNWPGDAILGKYFGGSANYNELYFRFWMRTQPGWQQISGMSNKIFRVSHWRAESSYPNIFQWADQNTPFYIWSLGAGGTSAAFINSYRCDAVPYDSNGRSADYYCGGPTYAQCISAGGTPTECTRLYTSPNGGDMRTDNYQSFNGNPPTSPGNFGDGQWHRYDYHVKMNEVGIANGIFEWKYDGRTIESYSHVMWKESGASVSVGWNSFAIGGNSDNEFAGSSIAEQWYAIDDVVVSTAPIPAGYVPGQGAGDSTPPTAPTSMRIR